MKWWSATFLAAALLIVVAIHASAGRAHACSCVAPPPPKEALAKSEAVFAGRTVAVGGLPPGGYTSDDPRIIEFKVDTVWKGSSYETLFITTDINEASCGFTFIEGREYIVYAWRDVDVLLCSRTRFIENADEDLVALGEGSTPESGTVSPVPESRPSHFPESGCELPFGYVSGRVDLASFGLAVPLAWLLWRRRRGH